mgnify:CR=1 FL=1
MLDRFFFKNHDHNDGQQNQQTMLATTTILLSALIVLHSHATTTAAVTTTTTPEDKMIQWMNEIQHEEISTPIDQNLQVSMFAIEGDPTNGTRRGVQTKVELHRGDTVLSIPRKFFMSRATAQRSDIGEVIRALEDVLTDKWLLTIHLMYEWFNPMSTWRSYLDTIPPPNPSETTDVLFWTEEDLALLQCSHKHQCHVVERIRNIQKATKTMFREIEPLMKSYFPSGTFTYDTFAWAYGTVRARCFTINVTQSYGNNFLKDGLKEGMLSILVPFGDLLNHHNSNPPLQHGAYEFEDK